MSNRDPNENGWAASASAWIASTGDQGDFARQFVLDEIMLDLALSHEPKSALDVGCGEGRFCRLLAQNDVETCGIDPVQSMLIEAERQHPEGTYLKVFAEQLPLEDASFDLVVSYLSLIDIDDAGAAISEMARVLKPGGHLLIANLTSFSTSSALVGRKTCKDTGETFRPLDLYLEARKDWFEWDGVRIQNWHRPLSQYMNWCLSAGLTLTHFEEPTPKKNAPAERLAAYREMPFLMMMEWKK